MMVASSPVSSLICVYFSMIIYLFPPDECKGPSCNARLQTIREEPLCIFSSDFSDMHRIGAHPRHDCLMTVHSLQIKIKTVLMRLDGFFGQAGCFQCIDDRTTHSITVTVDTHTDDNFQVGGVAVIRFSHPARYIVLCPPPSGMGQGSKAVVPAPHIDRYEIRIVH